MPQNLNMGQTVTPPGQMCMPNNVAQLNMQSQQLYQQQQQLLIKQQMAQLQRQQILKKNLLDQEEQILKEKFLKHCEKSSYDDSSKNSSFERQLRAGQDGFSSDDGNSYKKIENKQPGLFNMGAGFCADPVKSSYEVEMGQEANKSTKNSSRQYSSPSTHSKINIDEFNLSRSNSNSHRTPEK